jgi:hypothetical protein
MNTTEMLAMFICIHVVAMSQTGKLKIGLSTQERPLVGNLMRSLTLGYVWPKSSLDQKSQLSHYSQKD